MSTAPTDIDADLLRQACRQAGLDHRGAEPIRLGENAIYRLPGGIVARITRPGQHTAAAKEVAIARWLQHHGVNTIQTVPDLTQPIHIDHRAITFWQELPPHQHGNPTQIAATLRRLHRLPPPTDFPLPALDPFTRLTERINAATTFTDRDRDWMHAHLTHLRQRYQQLPPGLPHCVIHGDAWYGNIVTTPDGTTILLDLERCAIGPPEWDLVTMANEHFSYGWLPATDYTTYSTTYGHDVTTWPGFTTLRDIREFRQTLYACQTAANNPTHHPQAAHRLTCLQGHHGPRPWPGWHTVG